MSTSSLELRPSDSMAAPRPQIHALTGLRFFAALHVVVFHLWINFKADFLALPAWATNLATTGYLGVPLFFVLSGFVMALTYLDKPQGEAVRLQARRYWVARLARLYPVYLLSLLLSVPYFLEYKLRVYTGISAAWKAGANLLMHGALVQSWHPAIILDWNPPSWSLSVEAFFYAAFPFLVAGLGLHKLERRGLLIAALGLWGVSVALSLGTLWLLQAHPGLDPNRIGGFRCVFPLLRLPDFLLGIMAGRLFVLQRRMGALSAHMGALAAGTAVLLVGAMALVSEQADHNLTSSLMLLPFAFFLYAVSHQEGRLDAWLSRPWLVLLGEASYSVYILHWPVLYAVKHALARLGTVPIVSNPLFYQPAYVVLTLGLSIAAFRYVEAPMRERLKRAFA